MFFPATLDALHLNEEDSDGFTRHLLFPPAGCRMVKGKLWLPPMTVVNTDKISSIMSSSVMLDDKQIFPISPFLARKSRLFCFRGMGIIPLLFDLKNFGRQMMSLSYVKRDLPFPLCVLFRPTACFFLRNEEGRLVFFPLYND